MLEKEVNYRLAKWILSCMKKDGIISEGEMQRVWKKIAEHYAPSFLEVETVGGSIGDGVIVGER